LFSYRRLLLQGPHYLQSQLRQMNRHGADSHGGTPKLKKKLNGKSLIAPRRFIGVDFKHIRESPRRRVSKSSCADTSKKFTGQYEQATESVDHPFFDGS